MKELFKDIIGQHQAKLSIRDWYVLGKTPLLIYGSSGYGKTMFAESMNSKTIDTTQLRSDRIETILKPIKDADDGDILFFDEIHTLQPKVLEGLYKIIDKGTFYDKELCRDLDLPKVRFIFATNIMTKLPTAFINRCRFVELAEYTDKELATIIKKRYPELKPTAIPNIIKSSKGVPRTVLQMAHNILSAGTMDKVAIINKPEVDKILNSRWSIHGDTGLTKKEFKIISKVVERGSLSSTAIANLMKCTLKDAQLRYIEPLRASDWLAVSQRGVILGHKGHENYRLFVKKHEE